MKKNLTLLTGIVFVFAILVVGSCNRGPKENNPPVVENGSKEENQERKVVQVFLKAIEINGKIHLEMYDSNNKSCKAIDGLITTAKSANQVEWHKESTNSNIKSIDGIIFYDEDLEVTKPAGDSIFTLIIPDEIDRGLKKYDILFTVENTLQKEKIDPYLRIED